MKAWCAATQAWRSSSYSKSGGSTTQRNFHTPPRADLGDEAQLLRQVDAEVGHHGVHQRLAAELEEEQVAGLRPAGAVDGQPQLRRDGLGEGRLRPLAALPHLGAGEPLGPAALDEFLELVRLRPARGLRREAPSPSPGHPAPPPPSNSGTPPARPVAAHDLGEVDVLQPEAQVRLVVAVASPSTRRREAAGRGWRCPRPAPPSTAAADEPLDDGKDVVLVDEAHLDVDLGELGLAVEPAGPRRGSTSRSGSSGRSRPP